MYESEISFESIERADAIWWGPMLSLVHFNDNYAVRLR